MALQHLRSSTANKRPTPASMSDGQLAMNTNLASPGLFFKDSNGDLVKVGPVHVGATAPNVSPASGGQAGNSKGEQWLDTSSSRYVFKIWDGSAWRSEAGEFVDAAGDVMTGALGIIAGTAAAPGLYISGDTNTGIYSLGADQLALGTGGTGRLFIDDGGRIMAGTSTALTNAYAISTALTPAVQIQGNTANAAALSITRQTSAAANLLLQRGVTGTPVADTEALGQISFNGFDGTNYFNAALIRGVVDGTPGTNSMPGRLSFQTTPTGSTTPVERLRLDPAGQIQAASLGTAALPVWSFTGDPNTGIYSPGADALSISTAGTQRATIDSSGRVGIGTSSPGSQLDVFSAGAVTNVIASRSSSTGQAYLSACGNGATPSVGSFDIVQDGTSIGYIYNRANQPIAFGTNNTERARIDSSGRLLVGTSSARANFFGSASAAFQVEGNLSAGNVGQAISHVYGESALLGGPYFIFGKHRSGSIGGTTLVANNDQLGGVSFTGADGTNFIEGARIQAFVDGTPGTNDMPGRLVFSTTADGASSPTERMRIDSSGRVGIGTSAPGYLLDVAGVVRFGAASTADAAIEIGTNATGNRNAFIDLVGDTTYTDFGLRVIRGNTGANATSSVHHRGTGALQLKCEDLGELQFITFNSTRATIKSDGKFGIGTTSPAYLLEVAGHAAAHGYQSRSGASGSFQGNVFNIQWNGTVPRLWIDATDLGTISVSSDYRIKKDIKSIASNCIDRIKQLRPVQYQLNDYGSLFKADGVVREGFIAHEVQEVIPSGAEGEKDEENRIQNLRTDAIVAVLTKALQEAIAKIETLEAKVAALEAA